MASWLGIEPIGADLILGSARLLGRVYKRTSARWMVWRSRCDMQLDAVTIFPSMAVVIAMPEGVLGPKRLKLPISKSFTSPWKWRIRMVHDWIERWRVTWFFTNFWSPIWSHAEFFSRPREERCAVGRLRLYRNKVSIWDALGAASWYLMISRNPEGLAQIWITENGSLVDLTENCG